MHEITIRLSRKVIERTIFIAIIILLLIFGVFYYLKAHKLENQVIYPQKEAKEQEEQSEEQTTEEQTEQSEQQPEEQEEQEIEQPEEETPPATILSENKTTQIKETGEFPYDGTAIDASIDNITVRKVSDTQGKLQIIRLSVMNGKDTEQYLYADVYVYDTATETQQEKDYNDYYSRTPRKRLSFPKLNPKTKLVKDYPFDISLYHITKDQVLKIVVFGSDNKPIKTITKTFRV